MSARLQGRPARDAVCLAPAMWSRALAACGAAGRFRGGARSRGPCLRGWQGVWQAGGQRVSAV
jgi:hypothetical protein